MSELIKFSPSENLIKEFPEFKDLELYGTEEHPLVPIKQVQKLLDCPHIRLDRDDYELGEDYVNIKAVARDGKSREQHMLTEQGLYTVLARSKTDLGKKFRRFITVVMRELRLKGQVDLETALNKLTAYERQMDNQHQLMQKYQKESERYYLKYNQMWMENAVLKDRLENRQSNVDRYNSDYKLSVVENKFFKPIYVYLTRPPRAIQDEFGEWDPDSEPTDDEEICFQLSNKVRASGTSTEFRVMPDVTIAKIKERLKERGFAIQLDDDKIHDTTFRGTLDDLRSAIDEMMYI